MAKAKTKSSVTKSNTRTKNKSEQTVFSILLPTRGRKQALLTSIKSLYDLADNPDQIEVLLGMDDDDVEHINYVNSVIIPEFPNVSLYKFRRLGYKKLNMYVNTLAGLSKGDWIIVWNDDAIMQTQSWDTTIRSHENQHVPLLRTIVPGLTEHPFSIFPIIKREWFEVVGTISSYTHVDRFVYNVNSNLDWFNKVEGPKSPQFVVNTPITVLHDRYDLTGNNKDSTFEESLNNYNEGDSSDPRSDDYEPHHYHVLSCTNKLLKHFNEKLRVNMPLIPLKFQIEVEHQKIEAPAGHAVNQ